MNCPALVPERTRQLGLAHFSPSLSTFEGSAAEALRATLLACTECKAPGARLPALRRLSHCSVLTHNITRDDNHNVQPTEVHAPAQPPLGLVTGQCWVGRSFRCAPQARCMEWQTACAAGTSHPGCQPGAAHPPGAQPQLSRATHAHMQRHAQVPGNAGMSLAGAQQPHPSHLTATSAFLTEQPGQRSLTIGPAALTNTSPSRAVWDMVHPHSSGSSCQDLCASHAPFPPMGTFIARGPSP